MFNEAVLEVRPLGYPRATALHPGTFGNSFFTIVPSENKVHTGTTKEPYRNHLNGAHLPPLTSHHLNH